MSRVDSEFACEVVRITSIEPHPNADRLDLARFEMATGPTNYSVVVQRGAYRVGDHAVYLSVDCVVPLSHPHFAFLAQRSDGQGKERYRLRAARLRGVYSEGLLVPAPADAALGTEVADQWGVTYHAPVQRAAPIGGPTPPQPKKDWRRDLIPEFGVVSLRKAPAHFTEDDRVVITEKIHGTNFRFGWVRRPGFLGGWHWVVGSHRVFKTDNRPWYRRLLNRWKPSAGYYGEDLWSTVAGNLDLKKKAWDYRGWMFYGEIFGLTPSGARIQDLTYGAKGAEVVIFDMYSAGLDEYGHWWDIVTAAADMGLETPPLMRYGEYPGLDKVKEMAEGQSFLCPDQIREGVVVRSIDGTKIGKWVGEGYRLRKEQE